MLASGGDDGAILLWDLEREIDVGRFSFPDWAARDLLSDPGGRHEGHRMRGRPRGDPRHRPADVRATFGAQRRPLGDQPGRPDARRRDRGTREREHRRGRSAVGPRHGRAVNERRGRAPPDDQHRAGRRRFERSPRGHPRGRQHLGLGHGEGRVAQRDTPACWRGHRGMSGIAADADASLGARRRAGCAFLGRSPRWDRRLAPPRECADPCDDAVDVRRAERHCLRHRRRQPQRAQRLATRAADQRRGAHGAGSPLGDR